MVPGTVYGAVSCDYTIPVNVSIADGRENYAAVQPGDTVCILSGNRDSLKLRNFLRDTSTPITFINFGGQVVINSTTSEGILVQNSKYIKITGTGDTQVKYGIKIIHSTANGITMPNKTSDFEVDHIEVSGVPIIGISAKTVAVCSDGSTSDWHAYDYDGDGIKVGDLDDVVNRSKFTQYNSVLHDNYVHGTGHSAFYIGSSFYQGRSLSCNSGTEYVYDSVLRGVNIYNNRVENIGMKGIQVGSAIADCGIHHNLIYKDSQAHDPGFSGGVMNNLGSVCNIYNNLIKDGWGTGIYVQGNGGNRIYNNVIVRPGLNSDYNGIKVAPAGVVGKSIYVWNNTIINPSRNGIAFNNDKGNNNRVQNNIIVDGEQRYVTIGSGNNVVVSDNLTQTNVSDVKFINAGADDYSLQGDSPAIDGGVDLTSQGITFDYAGVSRPQGGGFDMGAYEYPSDATTSPTPTMAPWPRAESNRVVAPMVIDGDLSDWEGIPVNEGEFGYAQVNEPASDVSGSWQAAWDEQYLYVGVRVTDDVLSNEAANIWDDDSVEIFVDGDRDGQAGYDGNDHQYTIDLTNRIAEQGIISGTTGVEHAVVSGSNGYVVEAAIPWGNLGQSNAPVNQMIGFDLGINDDDDGGGRDDYLLWFPVGSSKPAGDSTVFGEMVISDQVRYRVRDLKYLLTNWLTGLGDMTGDGKVNTIDWGKVIVN